MKYIVLARIYLYLLEKLPTNKLWIALWLDAWELSEYMAEKGIDIS